MEAGSSAAADSLFSYLVSELEPSHCQEMRYGLRFPRSFQWRGYMSKAFPPQTTRGTTEVPTKTRAPAL